MYIPHCTLCPKQVKFLLIPKADNKSAAPPVKTSVHSYKVFSTKIYLIRRALTGETKGGTTALCAAHK